MPLGNPQESMQGAGWEGEGTRGHVSIPRNHFVGSFVTPFPSCPKPSSDSYLCLIAASSSSLVMCPWLVNGGQHPLPGELGLSLSNLRLLQGWASFSAVPWRWEKRALEKRAGLRAPAGVTSLPHELHGQSEPPSLLFPGQEPWALHPPNSRRV